MKDFGIFFMNKEELARLEKEKEGESDNKKEKYTQPIYLLNFFYDFATANGFDFEFAITRESAFISNRRKMEENPIYIVLDEEEKTTFMDVMYGKEKSVDTGNNTLRDTQIFYVYTSVHNLKIATESEIKLADSLVKYINEQWKVLG